MIYIMGTTNTQLRQMIDNLGIKNYQGCFFKDTLNEIKPNSSYIINLNSQYDLHGNLNQGSHWVALVTDRHKQSIYHDPFGEGIPVHLMNLLKKNKYKYASTTKHIQSLRSDLCGYFSVCFINFLTKHPKRTKNIYDDAKIYLSLFEDLDTVQSVKNEYILSMFFKDKNRDILLNNNNTVSKGDILRKNYPIENKLLIT